MSDDANKEFLSKIKEEISQKIKTENKNINELSDENKELSQSKEGYINFYNELKNFIINSMQDFTLNEEDLPLYFKSNISEVYQNYSQIRLDAINEIELLQEYTEHCKKELTANQRSLKFYRSQYFDSDSFDECLPLVNIYQEKIDLYEKNIRLTSEIIVSLEKIVDKLKNWK